MRRVSCVWQVVKNNRYDEDCMLSSCGISIQKQLTKLDGCVLTDPTLKVGNEEDCIQRNGRWNYNNKTLCEPTPLSVGLL